LTEKTSLIKEWQREEAGLLARIQELELIKKSLENTLSDSNAKIEQSNHEIEELKQHLAE
jgi:septal ring factor EnvC (AmiA/AmiB activator)